MEKNHESVRFRINNKRKQVLKSFYLLLMILFCSATYGQSTHLIKGKVVDSKQDPLIGVTVMLKGNSSSSSSITDINGRFTLNGSGTKQILFISYIGMEPQEIDVLGKNEITVVLVDKNINMDEVVVIGYGTQKKEDLSSSIAVISTKELSKVPGGLQASLQTSVPGVQITNGTIRIRGVGSINNTDPLYVVDGMIGGSVPDESNIGSIQILKDAASCAIYGARGANGVILITTKRGTVGATKIEYQGYGGIKALSHNVNMLNGQQLAELINEEMYNVNPTRTDYLAALSDPSKIGKGSDMFGALTRTGNYQKHNLSISGGSENASFRVNTNYSTDNPIIIKDGYKNYGVQIISDLTKGKLKISETVSINRNLRDWSNKSVPTAQKWSSTLPLYDATSTTGFAGAGNGTDVASALADSYLNWNNSESTSTVGNFWASYEFIPGLKYKFNMGVDMYRNMTQNYITSYSVGQYQNHTPDELTISSAKSNRFLYENTLSYDKIFGKHNISALLGVTSETSKSQSVNAAGRNMPSSEVLILSTAQNADSKVIGSSLGQTAMYSVLGRVNYSYASKYMLTANFRRDGSANFGSDYRYGNFPSFSGAWRISQEGFMRDMSFISDMKIRGSYGILGNSNIAQYQYQSTVSFDGVWYYLNNIKTTGALPLTPSNKDVRWENQYSTDLGIDLSLFKNRLSFTLDYYNKRTQDMLVNVPISFASGYVGNSPVLNSGSIRNTGLELATTYRKSEGKFNYSVSANISTVKNQVESLGNKNEILSGTVNPGGENVTRTAVGHSIGQFWGYVTDELYTTQAQLDADKTFAPKAALGDVRFKDLNDDKVLNDVDKTFIGNPIPKFSYGFNADASYATPIGVFDIAMMWQGTYGNDIYNNSKNWGEGMYHYYNGFASTLDRFRAEDITFVNPVSGVTTFYPKNTDTDMPRAALGDPNQNLRASSRYVEDGSYLRLKTLTIGYTLPKSITSRLKIDNLRMYVGAKNLLTFTNYSGYDPEVGSSETASNLNRGIDAQQPWGISFPNSKEGFVGLQVTF